VSFDALAWAGQDLEMARLPRRLRPRKKYNRQPALPFIRRRVKETITRDGVMLLYYFIRQSSIRATQRRRWPTHVA
jgi:uncharacterized membrane protein